MAAFQSIATYQQTIVNGSVSHKLQVDGKV
jgi:hypothetical protein